MELQILIGMIASGKSSYASLAAKNGYLCLNDDAIVNMLHCDYTQYSKQLKILYKSIENHVIVTSLAMGKNLIVDRGLNVSLQGRKRIISLANSFDVDCHAIVLKRESPEIHAERRFNSDSRGHTFDYWLNVAKTHDAIYVAPSLEEGFQRITEVSFKDIQENLTTFQK